MREKPKLWCSGCIVAQKKFPPNLSLEAYYVEHGLSSLFSYCNARAYGHRFHSICIGVTGLTVADTEMA
ncbi:hypothetical protein VNO77_22293 [Canavalia gladiata]|uniref:Uncharacterized protein n=1 Tax=Canavalia gladiata TaxID=3824 RepID=A0AAN9QAE9_CANGL